MGLRGLFLSGWASTPGALKQACLLGAVALLALGFLPSRAAAAQCPGNVSGDTTLTANALYNTLPSGQTACITVTQNGVTVNLNGAIIDLSGLGNSAVAIDTGTWSNITITGNGGIIDTSYTTGAAATTSAITSSGGSNLTITGVTINNEPSTDTQCTDSYTETSWGTGISLTGVTGATISGNTVSCYQVGIYVLDSNIAGHGPGSISGNSMYWNIYDQASGQNNNSAGLVLDYSSGWTVSNNTITYNGSADTTGTCVPTSTNSMSCAFGLQAINNSSNNSISNNTVESNYGGGIYTGPTTSKNTISGNTALSNGSGVTPLSDAFDLYDAAPLHSNHWHHNTCAAVGGSVPSHAC